MRLIRRPRPRTWALLGLLVLLPAALAAGLHPAGSALRTSMAIDAGKATSDEAFNARDADNDGLPDFAENGGLGTRPDIADTDADGLPDAYETVAGLDPSDPLDALEDPDGDAATTLDEYLYSRTRLQSLGNPERVTASLGLRWDRPDTDGSCRLDGAPMRPPTRADSDLECGTWDAEGLPDGYEITHGLDPLDSADAARDVDADGLTALQEFEEGTNPLRRDTDGDGLSDGEEVGAGGTDATRPDTDGDRLPDAYESIHGLDPQNAADAYDDVDRDLLTSLEEFRANTDPRHNDTDADHMPDGWELAFGLAPLDGADGARDPDGDGLANLAEYAVRSSAFRASTNPLRPDTDGDGLADGEEILGRNAYGAVTNPHARDTDADTLMDRDEVRTHGTNPARADTDADGLADDREILITLTSPIQSDTDEDRLRDGEEWAQWERRESEARAAGPDAVAWMQAQRPGASVEELLAAHAPRGDLDADGTENIRDSDSDEDELDDGNEILLRLTDAAHPDTDGDGMPDGWEARFLLDPTDPEDAAQDLDDDGIALVELDDGTNAWVSPPGRNEHEGWASAPRTLIPFTNLAEFLRGTRPDRQDTDCDAMPDGWEAELQSAQSGAHPDPLAADPDEDADADGLDLDGDDEMRSGELFTQFEEWWFGRDPGDADPDGDGRSDGEEIWQQQGGPEDPDRDPGRVGLPLDGRTHRDELITGCVVGAASITDRSPSATLAPILLGLLAFALLAASYRRS